MSATEPSASPPTPPTGPVFTKRPNATPAALRKRRRRRRAIMIAAPTVVVLSVATAFGAQAMQSASSADQFVTTTAATGSISQTLAGNGTLAKVTSATVSFPTSGTVTSVEVKVGDEVEAGDELATMDSTDLEHAVTEAEATLAAAKFTLEQAEEAADEDSSSSASASSSGTSGGGSSGSRSGVGGGSGGAGSGSSGSGGGTGSGSGGSPSATASPSPSQSGTPSTTASPSPSVSASASPSASATASASPSSSASASVPTADDLAELQQAVTTAQDALTAAVKDANDAVDDASTWCTQVSDSSPTPSESATSEPSDPDPSDSPTDTPSETTKASASTSADPSTDSSPSSEDIPSTKASASDEATGSANGARATSRGTVVIADYVSDQTCSTAIESAQKALKAVDSAQTDLTAAISALAGAAQAVADDSTQSPSPSASASPSTTTPSPRPSAGTPNNGGSGGSGSGGSGSAPTGGSGGSGSGSAAGGSASGGGSTSGGSGSGSSGGGGGQTTSVASAEADVAKAKLALTQAEVNLDHATLTAPISGTVASVPFTKGATMSTSDALEIVGNGAVQLTVDVSESAIRQVKLGQQATVSPSPGTSYPATVTYIDLMPSSDSSSSVTYPVTLTISAATVKKHPKALADGVSATSSITVASATDAVLVPVSAVTPTGAGVGRVTVVNGSTASTTQVKLGVMDGTHVQVTSGLEAGATVSLADRTQALPTSNTTSQRRNGGSSLTGGGSSLTGGGSGGFGGAPPGGR